MAMDDRICEMEPRNEVEQEEMEIREKIWGKMDCEELGSTGVRLVIRNE